MDVQPDVSVWTFNHHLFLKAVFFPNFSDCMNFVSLCFVVDLYFRLFNVQYTQ